MSAQRVRHLVKVSLLFLIGLSSIEGQKLNITANISPSGGLCQNSVTFSCTAIGVEDGTFSWYLNGDAIGSRVYNPDDIYPFTVNSSIADFCIQMMNVTITNSRLFNFINFTLTIQLMKISNYVGRNITCGQLLIQSSQITINSYHLQAPKAPNADDINFIAHYDLSTSIVSKVTVNWNVLEEFCTELNTDYEVHLTSNSAILYSKNETCKVNTDCQVTFMIMPVLMANVYWIEIVALDEDGVVSNASRCPDPIDIQPNISIEFLSCAVVKCYSTFNDTCEIQYSQNVTTPLNNSVNGRVNSDIKVPMLQSGMVYYVATFNVNRNAYILQSHTTVKCEKKQNLNGGAIAGIIIGALFILSIILLIGLTLFKKVRKKGTKGEPTLDLQSWQTKKEAKDWRTDELGMLVDKEGKRVVEDDIVISGHRGFGEKTADARSRVAEEHTREAKMLMSELKKEESVLKSETESNLYSQTEHVGPSSNKKKKPKQESNYSSMGKKPAVSPADRHYAKLQHNNSASVPRAGVSPNVFVTSTASGGSMPLSTPAGYSHVGAQPLDLPPNVSRANAEKSGSNPEYGKLELREKNEQEGTARNGRRKAEENKKKNDTFTVQET